MLANQFFDLVNRKSVFCVSLEGAHFHPPLGGYIDRPIHKGKLMFGERFRIYKEDRGILLKLCNYIIKDNDSCKKDGIDPNKGLLLTGPVTSLMRLLKFLEPYQKPYSVIPSRNIVFGFNHIGFNVIEDYGNGQYFCFDDLGVEPTGRHYGKDCNVMGEILLSRYELLSTGRSRPIAPPTSMPRSWRNVMVSGLGVAFGRCSIWWPLKRTARTSANNFITV